MALLKARNSGDASNWSAVMGGRVSSLAPVASRLRRSAMRHLPVFAGELLVGQAPSDHMPHHVHETLDVRHAPVIVPKGLFVNVAERFRSISSNSTCPMLGEMLASISK